MWENLQLNTVVFLRILYDRKFTTSKLFPSCHIIITKRPCIQDGGQETTLDIHQPIGGKLIPRTEHIPHWLWLKSVTSALMAARVYAPQGVEMLLEWTGPITRGTTIKATITQPLAASCLNPPQIQVRHRKGIIKCVCLSIQRHRQKRIPIH